MKNSIIIWAWEAWKQLYNLIKIKENIIGFFDDFQKWEKILWKTDDCLWFCKKNKIDKIYFAIPSLENKEILDKLIKYAKHNNIEFKIIPSILDIINWEVKTDYIRNVKFEDLLFRPIRKTNINRNIDFLKWKVVLITWAAWTIWSELVKQCLYYWAKKVIWIDHSEIWIFNQMKQYWLLTWENNKYKDKIFFHIKSIRDLKWLDYIFKKYSPEIVFNAAAYKHVYQMELNPDEAIKTDIFWLKNIIEVSIQNNVKNFCQISTDKAVNPTNIMWASKRIWELLIQYYSEKQSKTKLSAVRFGNVLWSSWSVLTIFDEQIKKWKDITVTDKNIIRYFMSIEEAVNLVITSVTLEQNWKIFVLDMWEPIKIYDLAKKYLELSNAKWIWIKIIWLKPWEKLYEELILDKNNDKKTIIDKVYITEDKWNYKNILVDIEKLDNIFNKIEILKKIKNIIPEFNHKN
jgi:FlaA1/EpsC-like NDP-sugar epimerase